MRYSCLLLGLGLGLICAGANAADSSAESIGTSVLEGVKAMDAMFSGSQLQLGLQAQQGTLTLSRPGARSQLTDNGSIALLATVNSSAHPLLAWHMLDGGAVHLGYDWTATANILGVHDQLFASSTGSGNNYGSATTGSNIGTGVTGGYIAAASRLRLSMGPLYAGRPLYWSYSLALGAALLDDHGRAQFNPGNAAWVATVRGEPILTEFMDNRWVFTSGRWNTEFSAQYLAGHQQGYGLSYYNFSLGLAYALNL